MSVGSEHVGTPRVGRIKVVALVDAVGQLNILVNEDSVPPNDQRSTYYTFMSDVACSITFRSDNKSATNPDPTAVSGLARTFVMQANTEYHWWIDNSARYFDIMPQGPGFLRWFTS